ncbi:RabGAP/TBC [Cutaneotrichosporon oleaginosum]|uniref:RabGAP/TBC n=1 Tax=Cutaneotrichosporon oleaginosum TaxID=879819 RepID=A0A0J1AYE1_9TREE|nr:RabGAP/TBC [Cutaneotrichosporon oleaginosum]KLT40344.1 RabGAP/TBC [Cutaneotrichosporon oleaginosum]TXT06491.1 hypothetical protein COLE_05822 [Cutaneotrichosporon oleaginosum]
MASQDDAGAFIRPAAAEIQVAWRALFSDPMLSASSLKAEASGAGLGPAGDDGGVILRSVYWRFYLGLLPPPDDLDLFPPALAAARRSYEDLRERFLVAPDGRWAADCTGGEGYATSSPKTAWIDPLSLDGGSPWKTWFAHIELRATIRQDVDRTFPDIPYFSQEHVRRALTTMLFLFSITNPDVGYRQGMHELLAVCLVTVDRDSVVAEPGRARPSPLLTTPTAVRDEAMISTLDRAYTEHDAFQLFLQIMKPAKAFYEWRAEEGRPRQAAAAGPVAPIITRCVHIQGLLRRVDPQLWERLESEGVEPQIWAIRWIRLILTRELPFPEALRLWDGMFAEDPTLGILDYVCLAMLLLIRNELIHADYPTLLTHLLHYPSPSKTYPFKPALILSQAKILRANRTSASGAEVVMQNHEILGVKAGGPDIADNPIDPDATTPNSYHLGSGTSPSPRPGSATRGKARAGMQGLAQGLFERAQKAGLDKAFLSTVNDLRSSLPDSTSAYSFLNFSPSQTPNTNTPGPYSSIPSTASALPRPVFQKEHSDDTESISSAKSLRDAERQLAEVRLAMLSMGKAMTEWMSVLREGEEGPEAAEAWTGLNRVRDTLLEAAGQEVDDLVKDWAWNDALDASRSRSSSEQPTPIEPPSVASLPPPLPSLSPPRTEEAQVTPKAKSTARMANSSNLPTPPDRTRPQLHLSNRPDQPAPGLTRTLHHPRPSFGANPATRLSSHLDASSVPVRHAARVVSPPTSPSPPQDMDPLAGLGVEAIPLDHARESRRRSAIFRGSPGSGAGSTATSPRMAVGSDPLGVHL